MSFYTYLAKEVKILLFSFITNQKFSQRDFGKLGCHYFPISEVSIHVAEKDVNISKKSF